MFNLKNKSLVLTSSIIITVILMVLISSTQILSYSFQKKTLMDEIRHTGETLGYQLEFDYEFISRGYKELLTTKTSKAAMFSVMKNKFDAMTRNDRITNAVLYIPDFIVKDGKKHIMILQSSEDMTANGFGIGEMYEMSAEFEQTIRIALEKGKAGAMYMKIKWEVGFHISSLLLMKRRSRGSIQHRLQLQPSR